MVFVDARIAVYGGWIHPTARAWMIATRPWSFPASFIAVLLAVGVASRVGQEWDYPGVIAAACGGTLVHAAANLINTYYDFVSGVDSKEDADDRTLVDGVLKPENVLTMAWAFLAAALACIAFVVQQHPSVLPLAAVGVLLAVGYTAAPVQLKHLGLGEATIFACFGPLLFAGASIAATGGVTPEVLLASGASGIATVAILHANNARDVDADRRAGAFTLAQTCGFVGNLLAYVGMLVAAFGLGALTIGAAVQAGELNSLGQEPAGGTVGGALEAEASLLSALRLDSSHPLVQASLGVPAAMTAGAARLSSFAQGLSGDLQGTSPTPLSGREGDLSILFGLGALVMCLHWAVRLCLRFASKRLVFMPQQTAQFGLLFGAALGVGVLPPRAAIRGILGILFQLGGINNLVMWLHSSQLVHSKLALVAPGIPAPLAHAAAMATTLAQTGAASLFLLGIYERQAALVLALFLVAVTPTVHNFWDANVPGDPEWSAVAVEAKGADDEQQEEEDGEEGSEGPVRRTATRRGRAGSRARAGRGTVASDSEDEDVDGDEEPTGGTGNGKAASVAPEKADVSAVAAVRGLDGAGPVPTFIQGFDNEFVHFWKNIGMLGGLVAFLVYG